MRKDGSDIKHGWPKHSRNTNKGKAGVNRRVRKKARHKLKTNVRELGDSE